MDATDVPSRITTTAATDGRNTDNMQIQSPNPLDNDDDGVGDDGVSEGDDTMTTGRTTRFGDAFDGRISNFKIDCRNTTADINEFLVRSEAKVLKVWDKQLVRYVALKVSLGLYAVYEKQKQPAAGGADVYDTCVHDHAAGPVILTQGQDQHTVYTQLADIIRTSADEFERGDSGWAFRENVYLETSTYKYNPLRASCTITLPTSLLRKSAVLNIANTDDACFFWAIVAHIHPAPAGVDPTRTTSYPPYNRILQTRGISMPVALKSILKFETDNEISVNVYAWEDNKIVGPLYYTTEKRVRHVNLMYVTSVNRTDGHYVLITDLARAVGKQLSRRGHRAFLCDGCLLTFRNQAAMDQHECRRCRVVLPSDDKNIVEFINWKNIVPVPFCIYADTEAILKPIAPPPNAGGTYDIAEHVACSFAYFVKCDFDSSLDKFELYRGADCMSVFVERLERDVKAIARRYFSPVDMTPLTPAQQAVHDAATVCYVCREPLTPVDKVRDHCHLSGRYRGPAHSACNLKLRVPNYVPIVLHNFSGYDSHFLTTALADDTNQIQVIAKTKEKYISLSKFLRLDDETGGSHTIVMRFIDSYRFLPSSLDEAARSLTDVQLVNTKTRFPDDGQFRLMKTKGYFPYEYVTSAEVLEETSLPPLDAFRSQLTLSTITDEQYRHAQTVWSTFNCQTLGQYSDVYMCGDVYLLADVFETFRKFILEHYRLDPAAYLTTPSLAWDAMKLMTGVKIELMTEHDQVQYVMKNIRGGLVQCNQHYTKANNKYMEDFDPTEEPSYIMQLDENNLYGCAMSLPLPIGEFHFLTPAELTTFDPLTVSDDAEFGYFVEVDLEYPHAVHDRLADLPFFPENMVPPGGKQPKLIANLINKEKYVTHYRCLQQGVANGVVLRRIHSALRFRQRAWIRPFIETNTRLRAATRTKFEGNLPKLMSNSVYGKALENPEKRTKVHIVTRWRNVKQRLGAGVLIAKPTFDSVAIFTPSMAAVQMTKSVIKYDRPSYAGFAVLELSKYILYDFHYGYMVPKYGSKARVIYGDTDSLFYWVETDDFYADMKADIDKYDTSNFSPDNPYGMPLVNKMLLWKMKDDAGGNIVLLFIGLRSKSYCSDSVEPSMNKKKLKGIQRAVVEKTITPQDYYDCLVIPNHKVMRQTCTFRSKRHRLTTEMCTKLAMVYKDDKRYQIPNSFLTLPWGHYRIPDDEPDSD
ncbi:uncharacterized protein LOC126833111 [Adelges cooleyi]|uniref:uncharacterized protein LOC126833111 n=1 Tax=Adelges cooleyi TaxID=133065 RepID=UPI0021801EF1|nr:uncharacterized protein LOC126833111 [Adelges cooleyi]